MATHRDVVQDAAFEIGLKRAGQDLEGAVYADLLRALTNMLYRLDEEQSLDFDPTDANDIPIERAALVTELFSYARVLDQFDNKQNSVERHLLFNEKKRLLFAAVIGESDFVESAAADY